MEWEVLAVGSAVLMPWLVVELSPSPGGLVAVLPAGAVAGEGLPVGGEVAVTSVTSTGGCPCVRVGRGAGVSVLLPAVDEGLEAVVCEAGEVMEAEGTGLVLGAGLGVAPSAVTLGGWDVVTKGVPVVLLCCGLEVTAGEPMEEVPEVEGTGLVLAVPGAGLCVTSSPVPVSGSTPVAPAVENTGTMGRWGVVTKGVAVVLLCCGATVGEPMEEVPEVEGTGLVLVVPGAGLGVTFSAITLGGWDVVAKSVPVVLLCCGLEVTAGEPMEEVPEVEGLVLPVPGAGLCVTSPPVPVSGSTAVAPAVENTGTKGGWDVMTKGVPVVLLCCGLEVTAGEPMEEVPEVEGTGLVLVVLGAGLCVTFSAVTLGGWDVVAKSVPVVLLCCGATAGEPKEEVPEVEGTGLVLGVAGAGLLVVGSAVTPAPDSIPAVPAVEEGEENTSAGVGWDVVAKNISVMLLVLLCSGLGVTAGEALGEEEEDEEEEEEECLVVAELTGGEEVVPLSVPILGAVVLVPAVGSAGLIPSALPFLVVVVDVVTIIPPPSTIIIIVGSQVVPRRELFVWVLGSGTEAFELFAAGAGLVVLFVFLETFMWLPAVAVVLSPPSSAVTVPVRISEMWIMDCCPKMDPAEGLDVSLEPVSRAEVQIRIPQFLFLHLDNAPKPKQLFKSAYHVLYSKSLLSGKHGTSFATCLTGKAPIVHFPLSQWQVQEPKDSGPELEDKKKDKKKGIFIRRDEANVLVLRLKDIKLLSRLIQAPGGLSSPCLFQLISEKPFCNSGLNIMEGSVTAFLRGLQREIND
ncbi:hypothetical protein HGM15179_014424 [Zosterops borbonicus]|uniref:Uncharacterized protein n=1 Tax=Zosterops borbonicus TaxID=364589 RepID=A0A8K1LG29_9PASS|nr:hypothetical protein HGM15179_014424 [Zosterops borbonicus]